MQGTPPPNATHTRAGNKRFQNAAGRLGIAVDGTPNAATPGAYVSDDDRADDGGGDNEARARRLMMPPPRPPLPQSGPRSAQHPRLAPPGITASVSSAVQAAAAAATAAGSRGAVLRAPGTPVGVPALPTPPVAGGGAAVASSESGRRRPLPRGRRTPGSAPPKRARLGAASTPATPSAIGTGAARVLRASRAAPADDDALRARDAASSGGGAGGAATAAGGLAFVVAVVELRNHREVGVAAMDTRHGGEVQLLQFGDGQTYANTLSVVNGYDPREILVPDTAVGSTLSRLLRREFDLARVEPVQRRHWNEAQGLAFLERHGLPTTELDSLADNSKYLCLAAAACLARYVQFSLSVVFAARSLRVRVRSLDGHVRLDTATARNLELVYSLASSSRGGAPGAGRSRGDGGGEAQGSLFSAMNHTRTAGGRRLLRQTILQPLNDRPTVLLRQEAVSELLRNEDAYWAVAAALTGTPDLERLCARFVKVAVEPSPATAERAAADCIRLKAFLAAVPAVAAAAAGCRNRLLKAISATLEQALPEEDGGAMTRDALTRVVDAVLDEEMVGGGGGGGGVDKPRGRGGPQSSAHARSQVVFAVRSGLSPMLDVARAAYCEAVEGIYEEANALRDELDAPDLRVVYTRSRGHHLSAPSRLLEAAGVPNPERFIRRCRRGRQTAFTTETILSLNGRQEEAYAEAVVLAQRVIEERLLGDVRAHLGWLYGAADAVALLDLLHSFACYATLNEPSVAPALTDGGALAVRNGRHPILDRTSRALAQNAGACSAGAAGTGAANAAAAAAGGGGGGAEARVHVPNSIFLGETTTLQIVTAPNHAGKSTYLRQAGLLVIMAHTGSRVPADWASFRLVDQVFTQMSLNDDMEANRGSFLAEMRETAYALECATARSLVLLDELGRSTAPSEGLGIAWAVCEELAARGCLAMVATHMTELCDLACAVPAIRNVHLEVEVAGGSGDADHAAGGGAVRYLFRVRDGQTPERERAYGLRLAAAAGFPRDVLDDAAGLRREIARREESVKHAQASASLRTMYTVLGRLLALRHSSLDDEGAAEYLVRLRREIGDVVVQTVPAIAESNDSDNDTEIMDDNCSVSFDPDAK